MLISHYVDGVCADLEALGRLGGDEMAETATRLAGALGPSLRTRLLEALDALVAEANVDIEIPPLGLALAGDAVSLTHAPRTEVAGAIEVPGDLSARFALRLPEDLKSHIEQLAQSVGSSTNSWIVRALADEAAQETRREVRRASRQLRGTGRS